MSSPPEEPPEQRRVTMDDVMILAKRRGFFWPSFDIYGGVAGFYDHGPLGTGLMQNFLAIWRRHYILEEGFLELDAPSITPYEIFRASGHVDKFVDLVTSCGECKQAFRADHLLVGIHSNPDTLDAGEVSRLLEENDVKCPVCGGTLGEVTEFNLMFTTGIGPLGDREAFLRPETAQNIFINFNTLYRLGRERLPLGIVQIGHGYRNEISPRQGIYRQREFHMAEAEYFYQPGMVESGGTGLGAFGEMEVTLLPASDPFTPIKTTFSEALKDGIIANDKLAHFMCITGRMFTEAGMDPERLRFRQHQETEMAHYAADCWDAEALTSIGWVELAGHADRSCYDLEQHMKATGADLRVFRKFDTPLTTRKRGAVPILSAIGPAFRAMARGIITAAENFTDEQLDMLEKGSLSVEIEGEKLTLTREHFDVVAEDVVVNGERFVPAVVEPSYGIDRILMTIMEHSLDIKEIIDDDTGKRERYTILHLPPVMAPIKVGVFPLMARDGLGELAAAIDKRLRKRGLTTFMDASGSIGRRYARSDEVGIPFALTVDYDSLRDDSVTIRDRETTHQIRVPVEGIELMVEGLIRGEVDLDDIDGERLHII